MMRDRDDIKDVRFFSRDMDEAYMRYGAKRLGVLKELQKNPRNASVLVA